MARGMVKMKRKGRISPYPGLKNAMSVETREKAFWCRGVGS
jgi:hypothetical protein